MDEEGLDSRKQDERPPEEEAEEIRHPDGRSEHPSVRYEPRDVKLRGVLALIVVTCLILAGVSYVIWRFYWYQAGGQERFGDTSSYRFGDPRVPTQLPRSPRLEQIDRTAGIDTSDTYKRLAAKERILNSYGPTEEKGFVHIPIQQAMKAVAAEAQAGKLPETKEPRAAKDQGLLDGGGPNSGRVFRGEVP